MRPVRSGYRPDIDGLRAIAVLSVILFHLDARLLPGGFVGVDVFFVLSGFLITSQILEDVDGRRFSLAAFYRRRIQRIAPAMLVVVGVTLLAAKLLMLPEDAVDASRSGVWSLSSLANVFFWRHQDRGYFAARDLPLLHLWSLGVEEQFYLVWPLLLLIFHRAHRAKAFLLGMTLAAVLSFALASLLFRRAPSFVYYMLPTRAGELLLGAIAASAVVQRWAANLPRGTLTPIASVGLLQLGFSLFLLSEDDVFPGLLAVPPTLGTALLLLTARDGTPPIARFLSVKPLVQIGLISYSVYLWHWPLLSFYRYGYGAVGVVAGVILLGLTLLLAWLSHRFVEEPARRSTASFGDVLLRHYALPASAIAALALGVIYADRVWPASLHTAYRTRLAAMREQGVPTWKSPYICQRHILSLADVTDARCVVGPDSEGEPAILLWGDSNAAHYVGVLGAFARESGFRFRNVEVGSCPPLLVDPKRFVEARREGDCVASLAILRPLLDRAQVVIISASWSEYQQRSASFLETFYATVSELAAQGKRVILIGKLPILSGFDRRCREKALKFPFVRCPDIQARLTPAVATINAELRHFARRMPQVRYFDANSYLCPDGTCSARTPDGEVLYYDPSHLSLAGSWKLGEWIVHSSGVPEAFDLVDDGGHGRAGEQGDRSDRADLLATGS
jgi:peptidoglycan/LPS O-acetylase OafA/YrhL